MGMRTGFARVLRWIPALRLRSREDDVGGEVGRVRATLFVMPTQVGTHDKFQRAFA